MTTSTITTTRTPKTAAKARSVAKAKPVNASTKAVKAASAKAPKAPHPVLEQRNGISRPAGGATGAVWDACDQITAATGSTATRGAAIEALRAKGINHWTASTQYARWRKFHGITGHLAKAAA